MTDITVVVQPPTTISVSVSDISGITLTGASKITVPLVAGEDIDYGEACYISTSDGMAYLAQSDGTLAQAEAVVICVQSGGILTGATGSFALQGRITGLSGGSQGALAYLSATAGAIQTTVPSSPTDSYSKILGRWISSTALFFNPHPDTFSL